MSDAGTLHGIGIGPGDPELITLKAARLIAAAPIVAYFARREAEGNARSIARMHLRADAEQLRLEYPYTTEIPRESEAYVRAMQAFYDRAAERIAVHLSAGRDVAVLCEGDPFLYGSFMYLFDRLRGRFAVEVVPGVTGMSGCWSRASTPMTRDIDTLTVVPATLDSRRLADMLGMADAAVVMKVGRHLGRLREVLRDLGRLDEAIYVERGTMACERIVPLAELADAEAPYFSLVLLPAARRTP